MVGEVAACRKGTANQPGGLKGVQPVRGARRRRAEPPDHRPPTDMRPGGPCRFVEGGGAVVGCGVGITTSRPASRVNVTIVRHFSPNGNPSCCIGNDPHTMPRIPFASSLIACAGAILAGCAGGDSHFMPRTHALFAGFDEQRLGGAAKAMIQEAKADFQLAKHGDDPRYAKFASTVPGTRSRVFEGRGYELTLVNKDEIARHYVGPKIVLKSAITGGVPFAYDEVDCLGD